jgi:antitoxin component YwqK of YwqJK toxin-antitoxin module
MKYISSIYLVFVLNIAFGQMTYSDFVKVYNMNFDQFEAFAKNKGYEYDDFNDDEYRYGYVYAKGISKQTKYLSLYDRWFSNGKHISYQTTNYSEIIKLKTDIKKNVFKLHKTYINEGKKYEEYRNKKHQFLIITFPANDQYKWVTYEVGYGSFYKVNTKEEQRKEYFENGNLKLISKDDKREGEWKEYYWYGNKSLVRTICFYKNGKLEGEYKRYYESGNLEEIRYYKDDKLEGEFKKYDKNGNLEKIGYYKDNKREGEWKEYDWYDNKSQVRKICFYKNDEAEGEYKEYYGNGHLKIIGYFKNGEAEGEYKEYYGNGKLLIIAYLKNGKGEYKEYCEDGQLKEIGYTTTSMRR